MNEKNENDVQLRNVTKRFGTLEAVKGVSLNVRHGEFMTLLGPSGCGKTTTLRLIGGFEDPDEGEVIVAGQPIGAIPLAQRKTRMVFQSYALFPHMTIEQNVGFGLRMQRIEKEEIRSRVRQILEMMGIAEKAKQFPNALSGGQQQRVALARALVTQPTALLLDEPLGALDLKMRKRMQVELKKLQRDLGITFIYVTHDQEEALALSDRVVVMDKGIIVQMGQPEEIYRHPVSSYVADFIGETNLMMGTVLQAREGDLAVDVRGNVVHSRRLIGSPPAIGTRVFVAVRPEVVVTDFSPLDGMNMLQGEVIQRTFLGPVTRLTLDIGGGNVINTDQRGSVSIKPGDKIYAGWYPDDTVVLQS